MTTGGVTKAVRKDVARNRARLLEAARYVFAERGLEATLDDIAKRAGVGTGTAYRHFANKQELATELLAEASAQFARDAESALEIEDPWEALTTLFDRMLTRMADDRSLHQILVQQRGPAEAAPLRDSLVEIGIELFTRAQRAGVIRPDAVATDLVPILGMIGATVDMGSPTSPNVWRRYLAIWFDGLRATGVAPLEVPPLAVEDIGQALAVGKYHAKGEGAYKPTTR